MNIKPLHIVILIAVLAGIIIYLYMKMHRLETDVAILKKKYENNKHLEDKKILNKSNDVLTTSDSQSILVKSDKNTTQKKHSPKKHSPKKESPKNDIFKSLGIPNIFDIFSSNNMVNLKNMEKFTSHPPFHNLDSRCLVY